MTSPVSVCCELICASDGLAAAIDAALDCLGQNGSFGGFRHVLANGDGERMLADRR